MSGGICHVSGVTCHTSHVMCHVSCVTCRVSPVTCHLSLLLTATATDPPPANSSIMHSRLVHKDPKTQNKSKCNKNNNNPKMSRGMPILAIHSSSRSLQSTRKRVFFVMARTHTHTTFGHRDLETESAQRADSVKTRQGSIVGSRPSPMQLHH